MAASGRWEIRPLVPEEVERGGLFPGPIGLTRGDGFYLMTWEDDEPGHADLALTDPPELEDVSCLPNIGAAELLRN